MRLFSAVVFGLLCTIIFHSALMGIVCFAHLDFSLFFDARSWGSDNRGIYAVSQFIIFGFALFWWLES